VSGCVLARFDLRLRNMTMDTLAARTIIGIPAPKPAAKAISFVLVEDGTVVPPLEAVVEEAVEATD
jgi:hypothetical protein